MTILEKEFTYAPPGTAGSPVPLKERYDNFIGGRWVAPVKGQYQVDLTPGHRQAVHRGPALDAARTSSSRSTRPMPPRRPGVRRRSPSGRGS